MGFLTPILFRNDDIHDLKDEKKRITLCDEIYNASMQRNETSIDFSHECLGTAHADQNRTIVVYGNTWVDLTREAFGYLTRGDEVYKNYLKSCIKIAQQDLTKLKKKLKELKV